jgi:recombination protein RecT
MGLLKGAFLGLDFFNKECYLIPYGNSVQFQTDYKGEIKFTKRYSTRPIKDIYAKIVREGDEIIEKVVNGEPTLDFTPMPFNDNKIIGAFAVCLFQDGGMIYDTMSLRELENTRSASKAKNSAAWQKYPGEMYKKTVLHRLCKHVEIEFDNPEQTTLFREDVEIETDTVKQVENEIEVYANTEDFIDVED